MIKRRVIVPVTSCKEVEAVKVKIKGVIIKVTDYVMIIIILAI